MYYSTVTAEGGSGLVSWDVSDGFLLDTAAPEAGLVMDGSGEWMASVVTSHARRGRHTHAGARARAHARTHTHANRHT